MKSICLVLLLCLAITSFVSAQRSGAQNTAAQTTAAQPSAQAVEATFVRENYTKFEYRIPMRDGVKLFTSVYVPKEVFSDDRTYPIMLQRTPYNVAPYGIDKYRTSVGPSTLFAREKFIFAYQDVRGRFMSEGEFTLVRPHKTTKSGKDTDESTDCYDTIEWLLKNVPGNTGKVGMWGISQPAFFAAAGMIDAHPALVAVSPQAPVTDYYLNDDSFHNGAFMLAHRFRFYQGFRQREGEPEPPPTALPFNFGTPDGYDFYLNLGSLWEANEKYFKNQSPFWRQHIEHTTYDEFWQSRSIWKHLKGIKPAVMIVGGWYDQEDPQGPLRMFDFMRQNSPPASFMLVMGPWNHGGFARGEGDRLGNVNFGAKTGPYFRERIEFPFFMYHLKGRGDGKFPQAWLFETGLNQWRKFAAWPAAQAQAKTLHLAARGSLSWQAATTQSAEEYLADPNRPVPFVNKLVTAVPNDYMVEDQRFAATRPDVLVFRTPPLDRDVTVYGPIGVELKVSTSGTDSDFVVKLIDVYPNDHPDLNNPPAPAAPGTPPSTTSTISPMGGYQQLIRGEPFRGKYRQSLEKPVPFEPNKPDFIRFQLPDVAHTFRAGHRIMVQIQSSWFPLNDRNPQKFMDIPKATAGDYVKATQRVFLGGADGSKLQLRVVE